MINNFDTLVARCTAMRRRRMIRLSLFITGTILVLVTLAALTIQWSILAAPQTPIEKPSETKPQPVSLNSTVVSPAPQPSAQPLSYSLPMRDSTKARAFVIQLTSSKSYADVNATRHKIPSQYLPSLAIYAINGFYTLRYLDIYDRASLPQAIEYFKSLGFNAPTAYKYNPERIAISENNIPKLTSLPLSGTTSANDVLIPVTSAAAQTPAKNFTSNRVFSVQTSAKSTTADFISAYRTNPKYETALIIARDFYTQENYVDAAIWAKKANQLNREVEEAWLLYAKSYYAQGRKDEAIKILELYLNYKDSKTASDLVRTWKLNSIH
ncbi:CDC27 family protein [Sulfuricurvum sp.]|uniref:CDC27 family protein n=1 Tax=Sulfuricurvum sp. TaxID=2025608 RepID=UPI00262332EC|nr:CDC27 family protein [Sulfuricurvum sp.]MDD2782007.1 CDC27 family protein [Sulfuricurvum sp.]